MKKKLLLLLLVTIISPYIQAGVEDLLITEITVTPTEAEFIEIYNNGSTVVNLSNIYITDATYSPDDRFYFYITNGVLPVSNATFNGGGGSFHDFHARFPVSSSIDPGEYQTVAINGAIDFIAEYGINPTYELYENGASGIPNMIEALSGSINNQGGLSDGEVLVLYSWDGISDDVQDLDYIVWGDKNEAVDKTGVTVVSHTYVNDTPIANQAVISTNQHVNGKSWQRGDFTEGTETQSGGNGINGADETSENLNNTFYEADPTPNTTGTPPAPNVIINEVDAVGTADFVELFGNVGASLNDVTLVFYQGSDDTIYKIIDLSGNVMDASGYFLISDSAGLTPDLALGGIINDDASAVAIYYKNESNFNTGDSINDPDFVNDIMDAFVYHSGTPDDGGLLALINNGQLQVNEDLNSSGATESNARCSNGSGGTQNTSTYMQVVPTAGSINNTCPILPYYANANPTDANSLRVSLHDIIKGHVSFPYSNGSPNTWEILSFADEDHNSSVDSDPNTAEAVWMVYKNNSYPFVGGGMQAYNREHTWPKSRGFSNPTDNAPRTDAHHLMMSDVGYNSTRNNKYYDNCNPGLDNSCSNASLQTTEYDGDNDGSTEGGNTGSNYPGNSNWTNGSVFEAWNFRKGDVARAMFYMDVRYEGLGEVDSTNTPEPDLILTDDLGLISGSAPYMGKLSTLLEWHIQDPVDDIELERNEVIFSYQGNRNPFVDHPEWVACIFQNNCLTDLIFINGFETQ